MSEKIFTTGVEGMDFEAEADPTSPTPWISRVAQKTRSTVVAGVLSVLGAAGCGPVAPVEVEDFGPDVCSLDELEKKGGPVNLVFFYR